MDVSLRIARDTNDSARREEGELAEEMGAQPLRGKSTMPPVSAVGKGTAANAALASAARYSPLTRPLRVALARVPGKRVALVAQG